MENIEYLQKQATILTNLYNAKKFSEAIQKGKVLIKKFPDQILFYNATALSLSSEGLGEEALKILHVALKKESMNIFVLNNIGLINVNLNFVEEAEKYFLRALAINKNFFDALLNYGNLLLKNNETEKAESVLMRALNNSTHNFTNAAINLSLGNLFQQIGNFEKSIGYFKKTLISNPNNTIADKSISLVHKYKNENDDHLKYMEQKISTLKNDEDIKRISFALGKAYEDIKNYKKSYEFINKANKIEKKISKYLIQDDIELFEKIKKIFTEQSIKPIDNINKKIIFIVGMPRSGTTLTEQIVSSHQEVFGAGELNFLSEAIEKRALYNAEPINNEQLLECQKYYSDKINFFKSNKKIFTDKAPLNFRWIGFILKLFPNSKIVHCMRDPMDICWSNFKNSFSSNSLNFTYDLKDLGTYYLLYNDLMNFWNKNFPNKIYNLSYEKLIQDQNSEIKKIINFCELKWDENCLKPEENKKSVATASLAQVRLPIYKSSLKKWKNYSDELTELRSLIKPVYSLN
jgi:tetratricopeptide (TPR) repeat protein